MSNDRREDDAPKIVRIVIHYIGAIAVVLVGSIVYGHLTNKQVDPSVIGLAGTTIGYLGGALTNLFGHKNTPSKTEIVNTPENPVPTESMVEAEAREVKDEQQLS